MPGKVRKPPPEKPADAPLHLDCPYCHAAAPSSASGLCDTCSDQWYQLARVVRHSFDLHDCDPATYTPTPAEFTAFRTFHEMQLARCVYQIDDLNARHAWQSHIKEVMHWQRLHTIGVGAPMLKATTFVQEEVTKGVPLESLREAWEQRYIDEQEHPPDRKKLDAAWRKLRQTYKK